MMQPLFSGYAEISGRIWLVRLNGVLMLIAGPFSDPSSVVRPLTCLRVNIIIGDLLRAVQLSRGFRANGGKMNNTGIRSSRIYIPQQRYT